MPHPNKLWKICYHSLEYQNLEVVKDPNRIFCVPVLCQTLENLHVLFLKLFTKLLQPNNSRKIPPSNEILKR